MRSDKKRVGTRLRFILPRALGDVVIADDVPPEDVVAVIERLRD
jgi:3-dehydroquinate synthetase